MRLRVIMILTLFAAPALAGGPPADDDWPCPQRRTSAISRAAIWSGPEAEPGRWDDDAGAAALARKLASRRVTLDQAEAAVDEFAKTAGADKDRRLTRAFDGALDLINADRDKVMAAITRYARGQKALAARVRVEADKAADARESADATAPDDLEAANPELKWDKRIFDDRSRALAYVCEVPVLLEKRAFSIARAVAQRL